MKIQLRILQVYFRIVSFLTPKLGGLHAFKLFQKVRRKNIKKNEENFYKKAKHFKIPSKKEDILCYELGDVKGDLVFLVHGWESNSGSLSKFAFKLADKGHRVVSFELPGHAKTKSKYTNLYECKEAFKNVLDFIAPKTPFSLVSHSFGSAVSTYTLSQLNYEVDKIIFLTAPNSLYDVFYDFKRLIRLSDASFSHVLNRAKSLIKEDVKKVNIAEKLNDVSFSKLLIVHDQSDKVIPFKNSQTIKEKNHNRTELKRYNKIGHYRMLWNDNVLEDTLQFIAS